MLVNIALYASPLSTMGIVIKTRNSASIYLPWAVAGLGCSATWFIYGVAINQVREAYDTAVAGTGHTLIPWPVPCHGQVPVMVPNLCGVLLNVAQLVLRALFPALK